MNEPFPPGFFDRADETGDAHFYSWPRLVTHIDDGAIAAVGALYDELGLDGDVLDIMSSWVSHFRVRPARLTVLGMNLAELAANPQAHGASSTTSTRNPNSRSPTTSFDAVVCCVSVDYLTRPVEVFRDVARVLRPGGPVRVHVLEPVLPDQGDPRVALLVRRGALRHRGRVLPPVGRLRGAGRRPPHAVRAIGATLSIAVWGRSVDSLV